jgi:hypothetical protein
VSRARALRDASAARSYDDLIEGLSDDEIRLVTRLVQVMRNHASYWPGVIRGSWTISERLQALRVFSFPGNEKYPIQTLMIANAAWHLARLAMDIVERPPS